MFLVVAANSPSVDALLTDMSRWRSPMLKVELMALAVIAGGPVSQRAILEAGSEIISRLRETGGLLSGEDTALALAFLDAARQAGTSDFLRPCAEVARLSRDEKVVKAAREAAAAASRS